MAADPAPVPPTGGQHVIRSGRQEATVVDAGGAIRAYTVGGDAVLDGFGVDQVATAARGCPLIPWPNRLHTGRYTWDGREYQTPIHEPDKGNGLHGFTRFLPWSAADHAEDAVTMTLRLLGREDYPFVLDLAVRYALDDSGLSVTTTARNPGGSAAPYALGAHPYITVGTDLVDDAVLQVPARTYLPTDESQIPTGRAAVDGTPFDFREPRRLGSTRIDHAFTDLDRDADGRATLTLADPDGRRITVWLDETFPYLEVFTGDSLPEQERRRRGLGVEPMTIPPNGFATGEGVHRLEPGEEITCRWGITPTPR